MNKEDIFFQVDEVISYISPETQALVKKCYKVTCGSRNGTIKSCELDNLERIHWFEWFAIPDATLTAKQKRVMTEKLQISASQAKQICRVEIIKSGIYKFSDSIFYVLGNRCFQGKHRHISNFQLVISEDLKNKYKWHDASAEWQYESCPERKEFVDKMPVMVRNILDVSPGCSEILFTATLLASAKPILAKTKLREYLNLSINLYGESGCYKSSLIRAICSLSTSSVLKGSYAVDRKKNILQNLAAATGFVYVLDDFHEQATDYGKKSQMDILNAVVRQVENDLNSGLVVTSAEYLDGIVSAQDRYVQIQVQPVNTALLTKIQTREYDMKEIVDIFITNIVEHYEEVIKEASILLEKYTTTSKGLRAFNYASVLLVVAELFCKYVDVKEEGDNYLERLKKTLEKQLKIQQYHMEQLKLLGKEGGDIAIFLKMVYGNVWNTRKENEYQHFQDEILITDYRYIHLTPRALKFGMKKYLKGNSLKSSDLIKHLMEEQILCCDESGDSTLKVTRTGRRALKIDHAKLIFFCALNFPDDIEIQKIVQQYQNK